MCLERVAIECTPYLRPMWTECSRERRPDQRPAGPGPWRQSVRRAFVARRIEDAVSLSTTSPRSGSDPASTAAKYSRFRAGGFDQLPNHRPAARAQPVHHDQIALAQRRAQALSDERLERQGSGGPRRKPMPAVGPSKPRAPIRVVICRHPRGTASTTRSPGGARPRSRVMPVVAPVSSM